MSDQRLAEAEDTMATDVVLDTHMRANAWNDRRLLEHELLKNYFFLQGEQTTDMPRRRQKAASWLDQLVDNILENDQVCPHPPPAAGRRAELAPSWTAVASRGCGELGGARFPARRPHRGGPDYRPRL